MTGRKVLVRLVALLFAAVAVGLAPAACVTPASTVCADGLICPPDSRCDDVNHRCLGANYCGDGLRTGSEVCESNDLGGETCSSLGFYGQTTGLNCSADCTFDTSGCSGKCGDRVVNGPDEECDGAPPAGKSCLDYGFDRGLLGCTALCGVSTEDCAKDVGWHPTPSWTGKRLRSIWGTSSTDVFAVGDVSDSDSWVAIVHWDGQVWKPMEVRNGSTPKYPTSRAPPSSPSLRQIWGSASNDVWALGAYDVLHWNGMTWSITLRTEEFPDSTELQSISGSPSDDVYVVAAEDMSPSGHQTTILKWTGTAWAQHYPAIPWTQTSPVPQLWQSGPEDVYLTMSPPGFPGSVLHWAGTQWDTLKIGDAASAITSIWGTGPSDVYALSEQGAYHWDGTQWTLVPGAPGGYLIKGNAADDIFVVGKSPDDKGSTITHWDGRYWSVIYRGDEVDDVWGPDLDNLYFTGEGGVFQPGAAIWNPVTPQPANSMWGTDEDVFLTATSAVDGSSTTNPSKGPQPGFFGHTSKRRPFEILSASAPSPSRIWGTSSSDIWGAYSTGAFYNGDPLAHWDGSRWSTTPFPFFTPSALGGTGPNDVWAVGEQLEGESYRGAIAHWDGRAWSQGSSSPTWFAAVWAQSPDNAFAVGGSINHWDGKTWSEMSYEEQGPWCTDPSSCQRDEAGDCICTLGALVDVWGTGANDVYAVSNVPPVILRFDGERWRATEVPTRAADFRMNHQLRASGPANVFLISYPGLLHHLRGGAWESVALPMGLTGVGSLWVTSTSVFLSGGGGTYRLDLNDVDCKSPETDCTDGWDNDCDGLQDAADPDCAATKVTERCANLADDDGDGSTDCDDPDCATFPSCRQP